MGLLSNLRPGHASSTAVGDTHAGITPPTPDPATVEDIIPNGEKRDVDNSPIPSLTWRTVIMGILVSMGGLIFGYDTGQISGFLEMKDFLQRFGELDPSTGAYSFSSVRSGLIVGLLSIGTLIGALTAAPIANLVGRRLSISFWCIVFSVGLIVQIASSTEWQQIMAGRLIAGLGVGALSILVPLFQSESAPAHVRGAIVCCYQLFITLGILIANIINYGTEGIRSTAAWRIPMGIGFLWGLVLGFGILLFPETPKYAFRKGRADEARSTMAKLHGVSEHHVKISRELREMKQKLDEEEAAGNRPWWEIFTGPRMRYRTLLGMTLQALQQLTGANFFFYYGTTIFEATGISNSYITQIILGTVNVACTFPGLYFIERFGRRKCLTVGGAWMCMCFIVFASVGHFALDRQSPTNTPQAGAAMIVFACLFIAAFASTWGPMVWAVTGELFPSQYRATCMALTTGTNWIFNFYIAFATPFITSAIDFRYGYVFAACCGAGAVVVWFFLLESKGRTLEEVDTMYILHVTPWKSSKWEPPADEDLADSEKHMLAKSAPGINPRQSKDAGETLAVEK